MTIAARLLFLMLCLALPSVAVAQSKPKQAAALPVEIAPSVATFMGGSVSIFSNEGKEIVTADDSTVSLWDAESGRLVRTFVGHADDIRSVSASGDGSRIISAGDDKKIIIWDSATGRRLNTLIHSAEYDPIGVAMSRDGRKILSAIVRELKLWDSIAGKVIKTIPNGPYDPLYSVMPYTSAIAMSPDGATAAIAGDVYGRAGMVLLIDIAAAKPSWRELEGGVTTIRSIMFSETGRLVTGEASAIKVWNVSTGQLIRSFATASEKTFSPAAISANGKVVAAAYSANQVRVWSADTGELLSTVEDSGKAVSLSPDGSRLLVGLQLFSASTGRKLRESPKDPRQDFIAFSSDGALLLSGYHNVWDARSGRLLAEHDSYGYLQAVSAASDIVAVSGSDGTVHSRNASTGGELQTFRLANSSSPEPPYAQYVRFSRDGKQLVIASSANNAILFDAATGNILQTFSGHTDSLKYADISSDGKMLLTGSNDGSFRLWNIGTGRVIHSVKKDGHLWAGVLSPDGSKAAVAVGKDIEIWDTAARRMTQRLRGHSSPVVAVFYSPDGRIIHSASWDGTIKQWAAATGSLMRTMLDAGGQISSAQLSPDGKRIVSVTSGSGYRIWNAETGALLVRIIHRDGGEWLVITPEGFFAASENGASMLSAVRGRELISIEQVYQSLYRPDLVREKLAGDPRGLVREAAARLDLTRVVSSGSAPSVRVVSPAGGAADGQSVNAEVELIDRGGGVGRVEWRVNGVTVGVDTPPAPAANQPARLTRTLALDPGSNTIEVVAYNAANLVASIPVSATVTVPAAAAPAPGQPVAMQPSRLFVIAAGIDDYTDSRFKLAGSVRDARTLSQAFSASGAGLYQSVNVKLLTDADVTKDKLDAAFKEFAAQATPADVFVLHLAGHGKTVDGRYYFVPRDFKVGNNNDEKAVNAAVVAQGIAQDQWQRWFASIPARKSMVLFDTCESGSLTGDAAQTKALEQSAANDRLAQATGRSIITASSSTQLAFEYRGHGLFTYNLLDAMERADSDGNGTIEINELAAYVYAQVTRLSEQVFKKRQEPQIRIASSYPLTKQGRVLAGDLPTVAEDNAPSFQLAQTASLQIKPGPGATVVRSLNAKTAVTVLKSEGGWSLVASGGKPVGYVATRDLAPTR